MELPNAIIPPVRRPTSLIRVLPSAPSSTAVMAGLESIDTSTGISATKTVVKYDVLVPFCIEDCQEETERTTTTTVMLDNGTSLDVPQDMANAIKRFEGKRLWAWGLGINNGKTQIQRVLENANRVYCYLPTAVGGVHGRVSILAALAGILASKEVVLLGTDGREVEWKKKCKGLEKAVGVNFEQEGKAIRRLRKKRKLEKDVDLILEVLDALRRFGCEDPRDRVYLVPGVEELGVVRDYENPVEKVYLDFAKRLIQRTGKLDVLNWVRSQGWVKGGLPSWIPRWMDSVDASCIPAYPLLGGARFYSASGALMKAQIRDTQEGSDDGSSGAIILSGIRFDEVDKMAAPWHPATDPSFETVKKWEEMALGEVPEHVSCPYNGLDGRKSALQKLCVAAAKKTEDKRRLLATSRPEFLRASSSKQNLTLPSPPNPEVYNVCAHRRLIATKRRHLGLAPATAEKGDVIAVLYGGKTPYLLRPVLTDSGAEPGSKKLMYRLMGEVYVAGIMEGEAMSWEHAGACMREFRIY